MNFRGMAVGFAATTMIMAGSVTADELSITNLMGKVPTKDEIVEGLITPTGLRIESASAETTSSGERAVEPSLGAIALEVKFDFDSASLTGSAREVLDQLGAALLTNELRSFAFQVEGHTDSVGTDGYNQDLSERRAHAVSSYLDTRFGIEQARLITVGLGESQPLDPADPAAGANRRVQIINLGSL